jgi:3-hydroxyacyl-[acyl-carrier-protein] dehydratase
MIDPAFSEIIRRARRHPLFTVGTCSKTVQYRRPQIEALIPHRSPILLLDSIEAIDLTEQALCACKHIPPDDRAFEGHFPGNPIYPGALTLEMSGQAGICLLDFVERQSIEIPRNRQPRQLRLIKVHHALLLAEIRPDDDLCIMAKVLVHDELTSIFATQVWKHETVCAVAIGEVCFVDP